ncbi:UspA domain-containing protein (plasmid) [Gemmatirosa kalamazoonensis]|uniref:UspA domain-containing protein n=1 Tax=Gemmatirosa kalamazoonensis TaxID=861299 RepID=W0RSP7_9BACT|nr:universal stress protein [Gemmatirosa kalamazoonensis]AHG92608.1 UspA domain-containing protein [Gemmatirosa kalamazoonensis]
MSATVSPVDSSASCAVHPTAPPFTPPSALPVLVATDGRAAAASALLVARRLAERLGGAPEVLDVLEPFPVYVDAPVACMEALEAERAAATHEVLRDQIDAVVAAPWPAEVTFGVPAETIARVADERRAALVVLGIGRHRLVDRLFGSETALQVLRSGDRPVVAAGPDADGVIRHAVAAVDFSAASVRAAAIAAQLVVPGGTLSLVHVRSRPEPRRPRAAEQVPATGADELLRRLAFGLRFGTVGDDDCCYARGRRDVTIGTAVLVGDPAAEVLDYAERAGVDLVAVGTHGPGLVERLLVGSVAADVVRLTSVRLPAGSVLCCPEPASAWPPGPGNSAAFRRDPAPSV